MAHETSLNYVNVAIADLTDAQLATLAGKTAAVMAAGTFASNAITVDSTAYTAKNVVGDVRSISDTSAYEDIDQSTLSSPAKRVAQGRRSLELSITALINYATGASYDTFVIGQAGHKLVLIEHKTGKKTIFIGQISSVANAANDDGSMEMTVDVKLSAGNIGRA